MEGVETACPQFALLAYGLPVSKVAYTPTAVSAVAPELEGHQVGSSRCSAREEGAAGPPPVASKWEGGAQGCAGEGAPRAPPSPPSAGGAGNRGAGKGSGAASAARAAKKRRACLGSMGPSSGGCRRAGRSQLATLRGSKPEPAAASGGAAARRRDLPPPAIEQVRKVSYARRGVPRPREVFAATVPGRPGPIGLFSST